ncbi:MAG: hypothetical protein NTX03_03445, partial [Bacteroidetes bacterium]|nr:hypothetical protein [Bacteroidota bacterium]
MEEFTGEWCDDCLKSANFFSTMQAKYPNSFIGVCMHKGAGSLGSDEYEDSASNATVNYLMQELLEPTFSG